MNIDCYHHQKDKTSLHRNTLLLFSCSTCWELLTHLTFHTAMMVAFEACHHFSAFDSNIGLPNVIHCSIHCPRPIVLNAAARACPTARHLGSYRYLSTYIAEAGNIALKISGTTIEYEFVRHPCSPSRSGA
jgi:hypothetical protein